MPLTPSAPIDSTWKLTFDDEFNTLETNHWGTNWFGAPGAITKPINTYEQAAYDPMYGPAVRCKRVSSSWW